MVSKETCIYRNFSRVRDGHVIIIQKTRYLQYHCRAYNNALQQSKTDTCVCVKNTDCQGRWDKTTIRILLDYLQNQNSDLEQIYKWYQL